MIVIGLTGSIGMGKSATAAMFAEEGVRVHDSDAVVHALYAPGGAAVAPISTIFPDMVRDGAVDRTALAARVTGDPAALAKLEAVVHPLVGEARDRFMARARADGTDVVVLDVPLLFEAGQEQLVDAVVVVSAPEAVQRQRVLGRPGMTPERLEALLARQTPDAEKRARADFVIDTSGSYEAARARVKQVLAEVRAPDWKPRQPKG